MRDDAHAEGLVAFWTVCNNWRPELREFRPYACLKVRFAVIDFLRKVGVFHKKNYDYMTQYVSLDAQHPNGASFHTYLESEYSSPSEALALSDAVLKVKAIVDSLPERMRRALELYYFEGLTQREISRELSICQMSVSLLIGKALGLVKIRFEGCLIS